MTDVDFERNAAKRAVCCVVSVAIRISPESRGDRRRQASISPGLFDRHSAGSCYLHLIALCLNARCHLHGCSLKGTPYFCCARHEQMAEDRREWPRCDEETTVTLDDPGNPIRLNVRSLCCGFKNVPSI